MKILLLADIPGWIVDRLCNRMVMEMPEIEWKQGYYGCLSTDSILEIAKGVDLIHYGNWDIERHWPRILDSGKPLLVSVRSHRFPTFFKEQVAPKVRLHVISRALRDEFPLAAYIPDALMVDPAPLRVGFAGKPGPYKGSELIELACKRIGAEYWEAKDLSFCEMYTWFRDIDVYCCASVNEGFGTPVMEALALNKPVVSTRCGAAWEAGLPVTWVPRTVDGIAEGLLKHWTGRNLGEFTWPNVADGFRALYERILR